jgi:hypothetical protein
VVHGEGFRDQGCESMCLFWDGCLNIAEEDARKTPLGLPKDKDTDRAQVAEKLAEFIQVEALCGTESPPLTMVTEMLETKLVQRPCAMKVLQNSWLAPPLFGMVVPVPIPAPSPGWHAQPTLEVAAQAEPLLPLWRGPPPPEPHPKLRHLIQSAALLPRLVPGDCQRSSQQSNHSTITKVTFCCTAFWPSPNTPRWCRTSPLAWPSCRHS